MGTILDFDEISIDKIFLKINSTPSFSLTGPLKKLSEIKICYFFIFQTRKIEFRGKSRILKLKVFTQ